MNMEELKMSTAIAELKKKEAQMAKIKEHLAADELKIYEGYENTATQAKIELASWIISSDFQTRAFKEKIAKTTKQVMDYRDTLLERYKDKLKDPDKDNGKKTGASNNEEK